MSKESPHPILMDRQMTNDECDVLLVVNASPGRRMSLADMTPRMREIARHLIGRGGPLILFVGDWVALTDGGRDAMLYHCAHNF